MRVDPSELRTAASRFGGSPPIWPPHRVQSDLIDLMFAASGLTGTATGSALRASRTAVSNAVTVITDRKAEWKSLLTTSADDYRDTDVTAARRIGALGDLNQAPSPGHAG